MAKPIVVQRARDEIQQKTQRGFQAQVAYTWSKSIDDSSGSAAGDTFQFDYVTEPWYDFRMNKGLSDFNVGHNLVITGTRTPSTPKNEGGSSVGVGRLAVWCHIGDQRRYPLLPFGRLGYAGEINPSVDPQQFKMVPRCSSSVSAIHVVNPNQYVNPNCFELVPLTSANAVYCGTARSLPGTCFHIRSNVGRNTLIGPGLLNTDFSIFKNNYIRKITETFNVLNRTNFGPPNANSLEVINSAGQDIKGFARITATQTPARQIQFALLAIW